MGGNLSNIRRMLRHVTPNDVVHYELANQIKSKAIRNVGFRIRQSISATVPDSNIFTWHLKVHSSPE